MSSGEIHQGAEKRSGKVYSRTFSIEDAVRSPDRRGFAPAALLVLVLCMAVTSRGQTSTTSSVTGAPVLGGIAAPATPPTHNPVAPRADARAAPLPSVNIRIQEGVDLTANPGRPAGTPASVSPQGAPATTAPVKGRPVLGGVATSSLNHDSRARAREALG
jgi:hypothetical protein